MITDISMPYDIEIDESQSKMYWSETCVIVGGCGDKIKRANLDGSGIEVLVTGVSSVLGIELAP
ncbi:MAG: hypothetical protein ABEL51_13880 [Salinibacter sp.]